MDRTSVQAWLDRYVAAWKSYDADDIGALFAPDATYRYHPYDKDAVRGREAIVSDWLAPDGDASTRDEPDTYDAHYEAYAVDGNRAVSVGTSRYYTDASKRALRQVFDNVYLLEFDDEGRCTSFTEYFMKEPEPK